MKTYTSNIDFHAFFIHHIWERKYALTFRTSVPFNFFDVVSFCNMSSMFCTRNLFHNRRFSRQLLLYQTNETPSNSTCNIENSTQTYKFMERHQPKRISIKFTLGSLFMPLFFTWVISVKSNLFLYFFHT